MKIKISDYIGLALITVHPHRAENLCEKVSSRKSADARARIALVQYPG